MVLFDTTANFNTCWSCILYCDNVSAVFAGEDLDDGKGMVKSRGRGKVQGLEVLLYAFQM